MPRKQKRAKPFLEVHEEAIREDERYSVLWSLMVEALKEAPGLLFLAEQAEQLGYRAKFELERKESAD
jgi:hypothetical protein